MGSWPRMFPRLWWFIAHECRCGLKYQACIRKTPAKVKTHSANTFSSFFRCYSFICILERLKYICLKILQILRLLWSFIYVLLFLQISRLFPGLDLYFAVFTDYFQVYIYIWLILQILRSFWSFYVLLIYRFEIIL